jgi:hypothetical protein
LLTFGILYGGHVYGVPRDHLLPALVGTVATGGSLMALEVYRSPVWPFQLRGLATFCKVLLTLSVAVWWEARLWFLTAAVIVGGVSSHMPGRYRYYSVLHGQAVDARESG